MAGVLAFSKRRLPAIFFAYLSMSSRNNFREIVPNPNYFLECSTAFAVEVSRNDKETPDGEIGETKMHKPVKASEIKVGDIISVMLRGVRFQAGRVLTVKTEDGKIYVATTNTLAPMPFLPDETAFVYYRW